MSSLRSLLKETGLSTAPKEDLISELNRREIVENNFPLEVFNIKLQPFINALVQNYDLPRAFVGLSLLASYSSAVGTAYFVTMNKKDMFPLAIWGCNLGISSSGKSLSFNKAFAPLVKIQNDIDQEWKDKTEALSFDQRQKERMETIVYRDSHIPTLVRTILPDNPKGVTKMSDELIEWVNGMNQLSKKEGTDETFWLSTWNCSPYSAIRSGKDKFSIPRPYVNVFGGIQYKKLHKLYANDRDTNGFIYRILFAMADTDKIANVDPYFDMPEEYEAFHNKIVNSLYYDLSVPRYDTDIKLCVLEKSAIRIYHEWAKEKEREINRMDDRDEMDIASGVLGKIKDYCLRFAALLTLIDKILQSKDDSPWANDKPVFLPNEIISVDTMGKAIKLADYFYVSGMEAYRIVNKTTTAPADVLVVATMLKLGKPIGAIAKHYYNEKTENQASKQRMWRKINKWITEYPKVFNAMAK
jgi:hypothetical protein